MPAYRSALLFGLVFGSHQCHIISGLACCWVFGFACFLNCSALTVKHHNALNILCLRLSNCSAFELNHRRLAVHFAVHFLRVACYCWLGGLSGVQFWVWSK